jgi:hypothetical protein
LRAEHLRPAQIELHTVSLLIEKLHSRDLQFF